MKPFMDQDFLLQTKTAQELFHEAAEPMPIVDFHNHLDADEIASNRSFENLTEIWLGGDHYKWRVMRADGVPEKLVTGDGDPYDKYMAWAKTMPDLIGNPLYHWTHLELQRYFQIDEPLNEQTAPAIWERCNAMLKTPEFRTRELLAGQNVKVLCTTNDPKEDLHAHIALQKEEPRFQVLPTFRPEKAMKIQAEGFPKYAAGLHSFSEMVCWLSGRLDFFVQNGCRISDHSLEDGLYVSTSEATADRIFQKRMNGDAVSSAEALQYRSALLLALAKMYRGKQIVMQIHIGALRNNNSRMFAALGPDTGFDSMDDFSFASQLARLLDDMQAADALPRTVLYCLNPKDFPTIAGMLGNFQGDGVRGKMQFGPAWWFCDHKEGMEEQLKIFSEYGVLGTFIGMLTDSRSFLSFPRHEYFRRILCNYIGGLVENGEYPYDKKALYSMVKNICTNNAAEYLNLEIQK